MQQLKIIAFTHQNVPLHCLGELVVSDEKLHENLRKIKANPVFGIDEIFYLATCNRVEFILVSEQKFSSDLLFQMLMEFYNHLQKEDLEHMMPFAEIFEGESAVKHIFKVMSSIDSMVLGEREIAKQMRDAYEKCRAEKHTGDFLRILMKQAIKTSKNIFTQTKIAQKPVSVASVAVRSLLKHNLELDAKIVLIGAGETNQLICKYLLKAGFSNFTVFNRSENKALELAEKLKGFAYRLDELENFNSDFDVLITCTAAQNAIITPKIWQKINRNSNKKKIIIDLAIPQDVSPKVAQNNLVHYISIATLKAEIENNQNARKKELNKAKAIIKQNIEEFSSINATRNLERSLQEIPNQIKAFRAKTTQEVFAKEFNKMQPNEQELVEKMLDYLTKKCISVPMVTAKKLILEKHNF